MYLHMYLKQKSEFPKWIYNSCFLAPAVAKISMPLGLLVGHEDIGS
jgi:hypothetical protein